ncbi:MAG: type II 3-dehydroquinate dehydratase [Muribaculaceae bacterium]|nr:type II 3-dehydroquinate dehydratase [Muribaculaceae bacterium]
MPEILIINGPNLNLTGRREPDVYGTRSMDEIIATVRARVEGHATISYFQSNHEGHIIDRLHAAGFGAVQGIVLNAGAYTHTSLAIADAIAAISTPVVEVHMSNVAAREPIRRTSLIAPVCRGTITGLGPAVYSLAVAALIEPDL